MVSADARKPPPAVQGTGSQNDRLGGTIVQANNLSQTKPQANLHKRRLRHPLADRGADLYETPAVAVHALRRAEMLPLRIWEPAAAPAQSCACYAPPATMLSPPT